MKMQKYIYWQDDQMFFGYFEDYPDYWTQGETKKELEENLIDIYNELTGGTIPCIRPQKIPSRHRTNPRGIGLRPTRWDREKQPLIA